MSGFFTANLDVVYFFYGFAFVVLGIIVFAQLRAIEKSELRLLGILWLLGSFGLLHAVSEFSDMFILIKGKFPALEALGLFSLVSSYLCLLFFGYQLINIGARRRFGLWLPTVLIVFFLALPVYAGIASPTVWNISARYFLGFPGAMLSAAGFVLYASREPEKVSVGKVKKYIVYSAVFFGFYGVCSGLVVPAADFFPASVVNNAAFLSAFGIPAQVFRALAAVGIAWSTWQIIHIFNLEQADRRERAQTDLGESEAKYRLMIENSNDLIWMLDEDGKFTYFNKVAEEATGYRLEGWLGESFAPLIVPEELSAVNEVFSKTMAGETCHYDVGIYRQDGPVIYLSVNTTPIFDGDKVVGTVSFGQDITGRKEAEARLRQARDELERRVEQRTGELMESNERLTEAKELSDALNTLDMIITSTLDLDQVMGRVIGEVARVVGSEAVGILLLEDGQWITRYLYGLPEEMLGTRFTDDGAKGAILAARTGRPMVSNDAYNDPRLNRDVMEKYQIRSMLVVSLAARDEVIGALYFSNHSSPVRFTDAQVDFAAKLSALLGLAFENARLFQEEQNIANTLQKALMTIPKTIPGLDFGYLYRSATKAAQVGGDFFDLYGLDEDRVVAVIGDVSGKGLEAAALTSLVKTAIKAYAYQGDSPATIMAKSNELIQKASGPSIFVTLFLGVIDVRTGVVSYCNAGHPPPVCLTGSGLLSRLETNSPVIGAFSDFDYIQGEHMLRRGDALVLYTDGLTEARCDGELYGDTRLDDCLTKCRAAVSEVPRFIYGELVDVCGCTLADDLALMAISLD